MANKPGRPSREKYWLDTFFQWERSGKTQKEFCESRGITLITFKKNLSRFRNKMHRPSQPTIRSVPAEDGTKNCVINLPHGTCIVLREVDACAVRDLLIEYYGETLQKTESEMVRAIDLAKQRLEDHRLASYRG